MRDYLYGVWYDMHRRCKNSKRKDFRYYGGRGIKVCKAWNSFKAFKYWALKNGYRRGLTLDRINGCKDYSPENCRFVPMRMQARNRRNNHYVYWFGKTLTIKEWSEELGMNYNTMKSRFRRAWTIERIFKERTK